MKYFFSILFILKLDSALITKFDWSVCGCKNHLTGFYNKSTLLCIMSAFHSSTFLVRNSRIKVLDTSNFQNDISLKFMTRSHSLASVNKLNDKLSSSRNYHEPKSLRYKVKSLITKLKGHVNKSLNHSNTKTEIRKMKKPQEAIVSPELSPDMILNVIESEEQESFYSIDSIKNLSITCGFGKIDKFNTVG